MGRLVRRDVEEKPRPGTRINGFGLKHQAYLIPLALWQELKIEASRRKALGLDFDSQQAIAIAAMKDWLSRNKGEVR